MDRTQIDAEQVVARYLAGRLPATESDAFERYVSEHPEICNELEQTLKFREGLARLRERGELDALLQEPRPRRWLPYAAAAALAFVALGGVLWVQQRSSAPAVLFLSPGDLASHHPGAQVILGSYVLARTRGSGGITDVRLPSRAGTIELRILPSDATPDARYRITLERLDGRPDGVRKAQLDAGSIAPQGYVTVYVDSERLTQGDYEISLIPVSPRGATGNADRFVIRVQ